MTSLTARPSSPRPTAVTTATARKDLTRAEQRGDRALRATHALVDLLARRRDLREVYLPADTLDESVTWCA